MTNYTDEQLDALRAGKPIEFAPPSVRTLAALLLTERDERRRAERSAIAWTSEAERLRSALEGFTTAHRQLTNSQGWHESDGVGGVTTSEWVGPILSAAYINAEAALRSRRAASELFGELEAARCVMVDCRDRIDKNIARVDAQLGGLRGGS